MGFDSRFFLMCMIAALPACTKVNGQEITSAEREAVQTAASLVALKYPDFDMGRTKVVILKAGDQWKVTYDLPQYMLGGAPVVF
jgi:hypothetical protein